MPRFFLNYIPDDTAVLADADGRHIARSLRMHPGEPLTLCDCLGTDYDCEIASIAGDAVTVRVLGCSKSVAEPSLRVTLYQGIPKSDKLDSVVQKAVELGVTRIVPMLTARCVSRPDEKSMEKKRARWQKIADEAAKQSGRGILPEVAAPVSFVAAVREAEGKDLSLLFYEGGGASIRDLARPGITEAAVFIGPEGGFEEKEVALALEHGAQAATLGPRILRTETAPVAALAALMLATGNME